MSVVFRQQIGLDKPTSAIRHATNCLRRAISPCCNVEGEKSRKKYEIARQFHRYSSMIAFLPKGFSPATPEAIIQTKNLLPNGVGLFGKDVTCWNELTVKTYVWRAYKTRWKFFFFSITTATIFVFYLLITFLEIHRSFVKPCKVHSPTNYTLLRVMSQFCHSKTAVMTSREASYWFACPQRIAPFHSSHWP